MNHFASPNQFPRPSLLIVAVLTGLLALAGCRGGGGAEWAGPPLVVEGPPYVELSRLAGPAPLAGNRVQGDAGDWLLRNERLAVVVAGVKELYEADDPSPGTLIDAAPVGGSDLLGYLNPCGVEPELSAPLIREIFHDVGADSAGRTLVLRGRVGSNPDLAVETRITLRAGSNALGLTTTVTNRGPDSVRPRSWGDEARWGGTIPFLPGFTASGEPREESGPFVTAAGEGAAYAWVPGAGSVTASAGARILRTAGPGSVLDPGESLRFERVFLVGPGSWADVADLAWAIEGDPVGRVLVEAADPRGDPVAGALAEVRDEEGRVWARGLTPASGMTALPVPPGRYDLELTHPQRRARDPQGIKVEAGGLERETFRLSDPGRLQLSAYDDQGRAVAARWALFDRQRDHRSGPDHGRGTPDHLLFSSPASAAVLLPPGRYRATVTRGPGYEPWSEEIEVKTGGGGRARAGLKALSFAEGWLAADPGERFAGGGPLTEAHLRSLSADGFDVVVGLPPAGGGELAGSGVVQVVSPDVLDQAGVELMRMPLGESTEAFAAAWGAWTDRLMSGEKVVAVAGPVGDPDALLTRSFIGMGSRSGAIAPREIVEAVAAGRVVAGAGLFVDFAVERAGVGSSIQTEAGRVRGHVRVIAPPSTSVREILIYVNNEVHAVYRVPESDRRVRFDEDIELYLTESSLIMARVDGIGAPFRGRSAAAAPASPAESEKKSQPLRPLAFTNPIRVAISGT